MRSVDRSRTYTLSRLGETMISLVLLVVLIQSSCLKADNEFVADDRLHITTGKGNGVIGPPQAPTLSTLPHYNLKRARETNIGYSPLPLSTTLPCPCCHSVRTSIWPRAYFTRSRVMGCRSVAGGGLLAIRRTMCRGRRQQIHTGECVVMEA